MQKPPSPVQAEQPGATIFSALRHAFFPFHGVPHTPAHTQQGTLTRIKSTPDVRSAPGATSPKSPHHYLVHSGYGTSSSARAASPRRASAVQTAAAQPTKASALRLHTTAQTAAGGQQRAATSAASERSVGSTASTGAASAPAAKAVTLPHVRTHRRTLSFTSAAALADGVALEDTSSAAPGSMSALQYIAIALPALQQQVDATTELNAHAQTLRGKVAQAAHALHERHKRLARLQRLQNAIKEVCALCQPCYCLLQLL